MADPLLIAKTSDQLLGELCLLPNMANRHGLIAGATGTGKTVTLQVLAERFSAIGVPVFMADVKGDLTGISQVGKPNTKIEERIKLLKLAHTPAACPVTLWDVFGEQGHPVRATISEMGPLLFVLARVRGSEDPLGVAVERFDVAGPRIREAPHGHAADPVGPLGVLVRPRDVVLRAGGQHLDVVPGREPLGNQSAVILGATQDLGAVALDDKCNFQ